MTMMALPEKATAPAAAANAEEKVLNIYNWPDYIAKDLIANFEKDTGIKVNYQTFENNEGLQAKLVAGNTGYDIVVPGSVFVKAQIDAGLLKKLDKSQIPNYKNLDANLMGKLVGVDPGNEHVIPWAWSFTTVAINKAKVAKALGSTPVSMPITEVYLALKTGQIDAQDNPTNMTRDWKFNEVTRQVVLTKHLVQLANTAESAVEEGDECHSPIVPRHRAPRVSHSCEEIAHVTATPSSPGASGERGSSPTRANPSRVGTAALRTFARSWRTMARVMPGCSNAADVRAAVDSVASPSPALAPVIRAIMGITMVA